MNLSAGSVFSVAERRLFVCFAVSRPWHVIRESQ